MIFPPSPFEQDRRARWLKIAAVVWLLLVSTIAIINSVGLSRLTEQAHRSEQEAQFKALNARVADLAQQIDASRHQPKPASQADFLAARQALEERLAQIEQAQTSAAHVDDVQALQARVATVEARQQQAHSAPAVAHTGRQHVVPKPKAPEPPFRVVGIEVRGGERFLSIAPLDTTSLATIRLLREGDSDSGWQLQSIDARAALFLVNGQTQRVVLP
ncbi:hypothetical protein K6W12_30065 [Burkholderia multivorans]|uniref:hypothetical protein n=1 Tax=Burkholderia multivorans TaxID=87883 RepID=UPI001C961AF9|nr:hypothetical protein [Burkholderia multivorans]MBY4674876.1 hypothetical protein [Burkholderia multivorans]